jgi:hypothetical protein
VHRSQIPSLHIAGVSFSTAYLPVSTGQYLVYARSIPKYAWTVALRLKRAGTMCPTSTITQSDNGNPNNPPNRFILLLKFKYCSIQVRYF